MSRDINVTHTHKYDLTTISCLPTRWDLDQVMQSLEDLKEDTGLTTTGARDNLKCLINSINCGDDVVFTKDILDSNGYKFTTVPWVQGYVDTAIDTAIGNLDLEEHDPYYWRNYYYGDPNTMPSPDDWFTFTLVDGGTAYSVTAFNPPQGADLSRVVVPYEHDGKPVTEIGESAMRGKNIGSIVAGVLKLDYLALAENGMLSAVLLHCVDIGRSAFESNSLTDLTLGPTVPVIGEGVFWAPSPQDFKVTVLDPAADYPTTLTDGTIAIPVIRPTLYTDEIVVKGTALTSPYQPWTATITPVSGTATITRAHGLYPKLVLTGKTTISIDSSTYPTEGTSAVKLSLFAGANEVELDETNVMYAEPIEISDTEWTTIYFERTGNNAWRAVTW